MTYLRLIQNKMEEWAETVGSALNVDVAVADKNLARIIGTGNFKNKIDENCPEDSLFAKVMATGQAKINLIAKSEEDCIRCSNFNNCNEHANMSHPLRVDGDIIGVISFASFDSNQAQIMALKKDEYFKMLEQTGEMIEKEISRIKITNKLKSFTTEVNEIINYLNKGIIILNSDYEINHINAKALEILGRNLSEDKILDKPLDDFAKNIKFQDTGNTNLVGTWNIKGKNVRVRYNINKIFLRDNDHSLLVSFDEIKEIINIAKTFENKGEILFENIIGQSEILMETVNKSKIAAQTDSTILIQGDSGTGKELLARSIHNESPRKDGPFMTINCASIPESLMESELFGYERGSFTGASPNGKKGKIELANNGTLFLDEIGDLPLNMQTKLLRVLQERNIERVGGDGQPIDINIRVIAATHRDLESMVYQGKFRLDLFYRLNVIPIKLPSLKNRGDDIFLCSSYIINKLSSRMNTGEKVLSEKVKKAFKNYSWPGNLRELENVLEHAMCFAPNQEIELDHLPNYFFSNKFKSLMEDKQDRIENKDKGRISYGSIGDKTLEELKLEFEKGIIEELISQYGDSVEGKKVVADKLKIGLATLYRKMGSYEN